MSWTVQDCTACISEVLSCALLQTLRIEEDAVVAAILVMTILAPVRAELVVDGSPFIVKLLESNANCPNNLKQQFEKKQYVISNCLKRGHCYLTYLFCNNIFCVFRA